MCKALGRAGYHPVVLDNLQYRHERAVKWGPLAKGTTELVSTRSLLPTPRSRHSVRSIRLLDVGLSITDPGKYYRNNFVGTLTLLARIIRLEFWSWRM